MAITKHSYLYVIFFRIELTKLRLFLIIIYRANKNDDGYGT